MTFAYDNLKRYYLYKDEFFIQEYLISPTSDNSFNATDVTIQSQGDVKMATEYVAKLCDIWRGPMSISVYKEHFKR